MNWYTQHVSNYVDKNATNTICCKIFPNKLNIGHTFIDEKAQYRFRYLFLGDKLTLKKYKTNHYDKEEIL